MDWFEELLQDNISIVVFFTVGLGFLIGKIRYRTFALGPVTGTLLAGVLVGQMDIKISTEVQSVFFMLFLFSIGYSVGPQFFHSFKGDGLKEVIFSLASSLICCTVIILVARVMHYNQGITAGMFSGSMTLSAVLGVASETIREMILPAADKEKLLDYIPACYAVTYVYGTIGTIWFMSNMAPRMLGGIEHVRQVTAEEEASQSAGEYIASPGFIVAGSPIIFRAFKADGDYFKTSRTVEEIESYFKKHGLRIFVDRLRINGKLTDPAPDLMISPGDSIVLSGRREYMIDDKLDIGTEIDDHELLSFDVEKVPVTISRKGAHGLTLGQLRNEPYMRGVLVKCIVRQGVLMPLVNNFQLMGGDIVTLVGLGRDVDEAMGKIGYPDLQTDVTDMVFVGLGIACGCFVGALSIMAHGVPISLSTCGGALLAGLFLGWARTLHPTFGRIPSPVVWIFQNLGLNMFIAVVGINAGASFISAIEQLGIGLFFAGVVCTTVPLIINVYIGSRLFHFTPAQTLGCVIGARCASPSLGSVINTIGSDLPAVGYSVTYAVANIVLLFGSIIAMAMC